MYDKEKNKILTFQELELANDFIIFAYNFYKKIEDSFFVNPLIDWLIDWILAAAVVDKDFLVQHQRS